MNWTQQRCLLTGASGGIGQAVAKALADKGVSLILLGRDQRKLEVLASQLPGQHDILSVDLAEPAQIQTLASKVQALGGISMLINNAGITQLSMLEDMESSTLRSIIETNLLAPMLLTQALLPLLKQDHETHIVNIGSAFGSIGFAGQSAYCASKFGLRGFSEALLRELADTQIRVSYLAPRATDTAINSPQANAMNTQLGNQVDSPLAVANRLIAQLEKHQLRAFIGFPERLFVKLNALLPQLVDKALRKKLATIKRFTGTAHEESHL